uniref:Uncharacterized protein n=1 Tax=Anguilla anguilla TaxID=7936 RepID=A0A0E9R0Z7_ANGAN
MASPSKVSSQNKI